MVSKVGVLVKRCKGQSVDIEGLSIEGGRSNILHAMFYSRKYLTALGQSKAVILMQEKAIIPMLLFNWLLAGKKSLGWKKNV